MNCAIKRERQRLLSSLLTREPVIGSRFQAIIQSGREERSAPLCPGMRCYAINSEHCAIYQKGRDFAIISEHCAISQRHGDQMITSALKNVSIGFPVSISRQRNVFGFRSLLVSPQNVAFLTFLDDMTQSLLPHISMNYLGISKR